tara:strand:- start:185 stop:634 length:450 start_codon:yes stop_codon:yes gene_type:complete
MSLLKSTPTYQYTHTPLRGEFAESGCNAGNVKPPSPWMSYDRNADTHGIQFTFSVAGPTSECPKTKKKFIEWLRQKAKGVNSDRLLIANDMGMVLQFPGVTALLDKWESLPPSDFKYIQHAGRNSSTAIAHWAWNSQKGLITFCIIQFQ